jgi:F-box protein 28
LDEVLRIIRYIQKAPTGQPRNPKNPYIYMEDELFDLSTMAMEYFKEHIEPTLPEITYFGADFLDFTSFSSTCKLTNDFTSFFFKTFIFHRNQN